MVGLPAFGGGEITMVARYTEQVTGTGSSGAFASFASTGAGWLEFYYSGGADAANLTGSGFNNGTLIGRLAGVGIGSVGTFLVTGGPVALDGTVNGDQFPGQSTVTGTGSQSTLVAGTTGVDLDASFFLTTLAGFAIQYENISIGLPYGSVDPSDCFNPAVAAASVGDTGLSSTCDLTHVSGPYSAENPGDPGYLPVVGAVNGLGFGFPRLRRPDRLQLERERRSRARHAGAGGAGAGFDGLLRCLAPSPQLRSVVAGSSEPGGRRASRLFCAPGGRAVVDFTYIRLRMVRGKTSKSLS